MNRNLFGKGWTRHSRRRDWSDLRQWCGCTCIREWKNAATYFATTYKLVDKSLGKKYTESHMIWETKQIWRFAGQNEFLWITVAEHGNITTQHRASQYKYVSVSVDKMKYNANVIVDRHYHLKGGYSGLRPFINGWQWWRNREGWW